jgi:flagellar hook-length control protein FliK
MKTVSVEAAALISNVSTGKLSKQNKSGQGISSFSNLIGNITLASQKDLMNLSSEKDSEPVMAKRAVNTAAKSKLDSDDTVHDVNEANADKASKTAYDSQKVSSNNICEEKISEDESLEEASDKVKNILIDILNISEEELASAMQLLGLEYLDCLDKNNLAKLLTQLSGSSDISALITDEKLYQQFDEAFTLIGNVKEDLLAELGMTEDELTAVLEQMKTIQDTTETTNLAADESQMSMMSNEETSNITDAAKENASANIANPKDTAIQQEKVITDTSEEVSDEPAKAATVTSDTQDSTKQQTDSQEELDAKQPGTIKAESKTDGNYQELALGQVKPENALNNLEEAVPINEKTLVDMESIVKQIESRIKVSSNLDTTKMEFQLNPEHLGKLTIQVASKEGVITAQITAQNLAVKEVLESQIVQLKDNMNNQGLKVEAVEVTVESHEFERNLEEGNSNTNQEQFEQQQKNTRRQFGFNDLEALDDMPAEEALIAEMMIGNGNTVNYSA